MTPHPNRYLDPLPPPGSVYRLSCEQYEAMARHEILPDEESVWLLEGIIIWKGAPFSVGRLPPPGSVYRITVKQYAAMAKHGIIGEDEPVELIEGIITRKGGAK